jgi:DNA-binding transcriptional LysR family regulator
MIDLEAFGSLTAVDRYGSVVAAADALGYTPSAVSQQIKRLEKQAGVALLERVGRGVMLTGSGRQLVDQGARLLADLESIEAGLHLAAGTVAGHLRVAAFSTAMRGLVAPAVGRIAGQYPDLTIALLEREPWDTIDLVAAGQVDLGVVHSWGDVTLPIPDHLGTVHIADDVADVLMHADHRLAGRRTVTPKDLLDEGWIATPDGTICRQWLQRMYQGTGRMPRIAHQAMEFESHIALVEAGLGIALVPRLGRGALPTTVVAKVTRDPVPSRRITVLHRRSMADSPAVQAVIAGLRTA